MAQPTQQVEKARQAVRALMSGIAGMDEARETLVDLGGVSFISFLDDDPDVYDISSAEVVAALVTALDALNATLDANDGAHRKALRKLL
jgi:hypothetical protein